ncbi:hypothetical protein ARZXY2_4788 (plasmid) [Arthrobacter sp. ZXY-2]|nr:hypothetical protein ARZXY2_4788 [Arthrobacter sp. ZXY-2]
MQSPPAIAKRNSKGQHQRGNRVKITLCTGIHQLGGGIHQDIWQVARDSGSAR